MTEQPEIDGGDGAPQDLEQRLNDIESSVLKEIETDVRLKNGVPNSQQDSDLDFIQMTGLTTPGLLKNTADEALAIEEPESLGPETPVSFFEQGVGDVDSALAPTSLEADPENNQELVATPLSLSEARKDSGATENSRTDYLAELKDLIEDIHGLDGEDVPAQEPEVRVVPVKPMAAIPEQIPKQAATVTEAEAENDEAVSTRTEAAAFEELTRELEQLDLNAEETKVESERDSAGPPAQAKPTPEASSAFDEAALDSIGVGNEPPEASAALEAEPTPAECEAIEGSQAPGHAQALASSASSPPSPLSSIPSELAEAETLLQALEAQERVGQSPLTDDDLDHFAKQLEAIPAAINRESLAYEVRDEDGESDRRRRRGMKHKRTWDERLFRWFMRIAALCAVAIGAYMTYDYYQQMTSSPQELFRRGTRLMEDQRYAEASAVFSSFVEQYPEDFQASDAQFRAAYALSIFPSVPWERAHAAYEESERLFNVFIEQNPKHTKRARAETVKGTLLFKLERYEDAIRVLSDSRRRMEDPEAYLPSLRYLARSFAKLGRIDEAHSAYLRAASLDVNLEPDKDFLELANLYRRLAENAPNGIEEEKFRANAIAQWKHALAVPALPSLDKRKVQSLINREKARLAALSESDSKAQDPSESALSIEDSVLDDAASVVGETTSVNAPSIESAEQSSDAP